MTTLHIDGTFAGWQRSAREAVAAGVRPDDVQWQAAGRDQGAFAWEPAVMSAVHEAPASAAPPRIRVPRAFMELGREAACYRSDEPWPLLYRLLWRLTHGEPQLLENLVDPDVLTLHRLARAVLRDRHKMRAFVRFREVVTAEGAWFVAWFEPQHRILEAGVSFFVERFANMRWSILTPDGCAHWDGRALRFTSGVTRDAAPASDAAEDLWRTYYASIFNPARVKVAAMVKEMPQRYWPNLPEAALIPDLLAGAGSRMDGMVEASRARSDATFGRAPVPAASDLATLRRAAEHCQACPLWRNASCTVFGEGAAHARIVMVGEQPGDQEDRVGRPFVGPAGQLLDRALRAAGVERGELYLTNAVKHFKWEPRGKRRLHQKPGAREIAACRPWLEAELALLRPRLIVCLGVTAAESVLRRDVRVLEERGRRVSTEYGAVALLTVHPSSLLRLPPGEDPDVAFQRFVADLRGMVA